MFILINIIIFILINYLVYKIYNIKRTKLFYLISLIITTVISYILTKLQLYNYINLIINSLLLNLLLNIKIFKNKLHENNFLTIFLFFLTIFLLLETTVFNIRHYESLFYKDSVSLSITDTTNLEKINNTKYKMTDPYNYLEIKGIYKHIDNLYLDIKSSDDSVKYNIYITDKGNRKYYKLPIRSVTNNLPISKYVKLNLKGRTRKLKIRFRYDYRGNAKNIVDIKDIKINVIRPFNLMYLRVLVLTILFSFIYLLRPKSKIHDYKLITTEKNNKKFNILSISIFIIFHIGLLFLLTNLNNVFTKPTTMNQLQYNYLAQSFDNKRVDIDYEVADTLKNLPNPYDRYFRDVEIEKNEEEYLWDYSYHNEKYYVYFGVVPVIIAYYPVYKLFNINLRNSTYIFIALILIMIVILKLLKLIIKKYFKNISTINYLLMSLLFISSSYLLYAAKRPDLYSVPIISAILFSLLGIYLWISSIKEDNVDILKVFLGSLSMALVAGCRPQLLLGSIFSIIIFKDYFKKHKKFKDILAFIIPYIVVALLLMYYNYIRFDSIFDFGANYNLTTNDMTIRGFDLDRLFLGIYYTLFSSVDITPVFPFIKHSVVETQYMGVTISESFFGGMLRYNLILIIGLFSFKLKKIINNNMLYKFSITANIIAILLIIVDTQMAGVLPRYILDYSWLLMLSTAISVFAIFNNYNKNQKYILTIFLILIFLSVSYNYILIPNDISFAINKYEPYKFQKLAYYFQFWL